MTTTLEERAWEMRELLAKAIHTENGECDCDDFWDDITEAGYECGCFQLADAVLKSEWLTQVQAEARERLAAWMIEHSFATGHGDTFEDLLKELEWQVKELRQKTAEARLAALEEVAQWLEVNHRDDDDEQWEACCNLPDKIRALAQSSRSRKGENGL